MAMAPEVRPLRKPLVYVQAGTLYFGIQNGKPPFRGLRTPASELFASARKSGAPLGLMVGEAAEYNSASSVNTLRRLARFLLPDLQSPLWRSFFLGDRP